MIGLALKLWDMYDNRKKRQIGNWTRNQNSILYIESNIIDVWRWIFVQSMISHKEIFIYENF
jgi:hypothetical protein